VQEPEQCDGTTGLGPNQECSAQCTIIDIPFCGDELVNQASEQCDGTDGVGPNQECNEQCMLVDIPFCGDNIVNQESEQCDGSTDQENYICTAQCTLEYVPFCGDNLINQETEQCDGTTGVGPNQECNEQCMLVDLPFCGDNLVNQETEQCDGSAPEGYTCTQTCELEPLSCLDITYNEPYYTNGTTQWIDTISTIELEINTEVSTCLEATHYYEPILVDDSYCLNSCEAWQPNLQGVEVYDQPFGLEQEACYVVAYYSEFAEENSTLQWDCVFSDKTAPVVETEALFSYENMSELNQELGSVFYPVLSPEDPFCDDGVCLDVTLDTPIAISCNEQGPNPSGVASMCFSVRVDGDDATSEYCDFYSGTMQDGQCCMGAETFNLEFLEDSWHELNVSCSDNVGKTSSDVGYYKVEGNAFEIQINNKWNLISIPFALLDNSVEDVFAGHENNVEAVWTFENNEWFVYTPDGVNNDNLEVMLPGWGYWVLATGNDTLLVSGTLFAPAVTPPSKEIVEGWNLVGYYGTEGSPIGSNGLRGYYGPDGNGASASCALNSLTGNFFDEEVDSLWTYWEVFNPDTWISLSSNQQLDPGAGYWLFAQEEGIYAPGANCFTL
jgi:hypothetical protein